MIVIFVYFIMALLTIESRTNRENNQQAALKRATDHAIERVLETQSFTVYTNEEFVAAVTMMICDSLISNDGTSSDNTTPDENLAITIEVVQADYKRGLLSLNVVNEFTNPLGSIGTCEYATTVVFDQAKIYDTYRLNYYDANGILISGYIIRAGDDWPVPSESVINSFGINKWHSEPDGGGIEFAMPADGIVPYDTSTDNISTRYPDFYDSANKAVNLYGCP